MIGFGSNERAGGRWFKPRRRLVSHERVTHLAAGADGSLWVGTPAGVSRIDADGTWMHITRRQGLEHRQVQSLTRDGQDRAWVGTDTSLVRIEPDGVVWLKAPMPSSRVKGYRVSSRVTLAGVDDRRCRRQHLVGCESNRRPISRCNSPHRLTGRGARLGRPHVGLAYRPVSTSRSPDWADRRSYSM